MIIVLVTIKKTVREKSFAIPARQDAFFEEAPGETLWRESQLGS